MLILTRKPGESVYIGDDVKITIVEIKGHQIRVGIDAPRELRIYREEIYLQILEENKQAAEAAMVSESGLDGLTEAWKGVKRQSVSKAGGGKPGLASLSTSKTTVVRDPEVVIRRKKKSDDE
ncbi:carbon storage regulator CsrA [Oligoflexia bacterium]|nr:carbon storage regulator CsrA [Oligoflexia bacterium]